MSHQIFNNRDTLEMILACLGPADIKTAALVCRSWKVVVEHTRFWKWARLTLDRENYQEVIQSLQTGQSQVHNVQKIRGSRVNIVQEIRIVVTSGPANFILNIMKTLFTNLMLKRLEVEVAESTGSELVNLPSLNPVLLSQALVRLEECSFRPFTVFRPFSTDQLVSIFTAIDQTNNLKLKTLNLPNQDYSQVPSEVLAAALVKLEECNILELPLSLVQVSSLFTKMAESPIMNIKSLNLDVMNCYNIPPELFGKALVRITLVRKFHKITHNQVSCLFHKIATTEDLKLQVLCLSACLTTISHIPPHVVAVAVTRLEKFCTFNVFQSGNLTTTQISAVLTRLSRVETNSLRSLSIRYKNLSSIPTETLVAGISGLQEVKLRFTWLTREQITEIYRMVADKRCSRLKEISLQGNNNDCFSQDMQDLRYRATLNKSVRIIY